MFNLDEANKMLDTFASVGAMHFDVTFIDIDGQKRGFRAHQSVRQLRNSLPQLIPGLEERQQNIIVRPNCEKYQIVQLDDLGCEQLKPLAAVSFLILETSPSNHQAWVAVSGIEGDAKDFARRLRKGVHADATASGATRVAGTVNYKRKYEPAFPEVKTVQAVPGRLTTQAQLESLGLLAAPDPAHDAPASPLRVSSLSSTSGGSWPDYGRCVVDARPKHDNSGPDISRADFTWCIMAARRGHAASEIGNRLMEVSSKAKENGERYAVRTAQNAVDAFAREQDRRRGRA
jgi:RepB DNA-primase from phage plasmid